jgi:NAD+ diphosphatase
MIFVPALRVTEPATPLAWCLAFVDGKFVLPDGGELQPQPFLAFEAPASSRHYLGRLGGFDCWALGLPQVPEGWQAVPLRTAMLQFPAALMGAAARASMVLEWDRAHRYCGVCGTPTQPQVHERSRKCPACGHVAYPRLSPAMMALVWRGAGASAELLLARSPHYAKGMFSALAGFVEPGESIEDCIHREVAEEVGVRVSNLRYYGSQSWPFPHSLMVAYTAEWAGGEIVPQEDEIEAAGWFGIDALPGIPPRLSIAGHLIRDTVEALRAAR